MTSGAVAAEVERQIAALREGAAELYGEDTLRERLAVGLREGRPLRVKLGMDPSSPDLHLGHTVVLGKLARFQELGHVPIFLVGDFTARIGDPSGRKKTRPALSAEEVRKNAETYVDQVGRILDVSRAEVRFNSEWMEAMHPADFVRLCSKSTVARLLERDDFAKRYAAGEPISLHELLYPFVQAYDSVALHADVELGGSDQTFNLLMAREIQRDYGQPPQAVLTHPLLVGLDGREKMSKSLGNAVGITEAPEEIYGKTLSVSDALMLEWLELLVALTGPDLREAARDVAAGRGDPLGLKHELAYRLVERLHDRAAADAARAHFERVVRRKQAPAELPEVAVPVAADGGMGVLPLLERLGLVPSRSEGRRLVAQGAVRIDGEPVADPTRRLAPGSYLIQVGKRRFARARLG